MAQPDGGESLAFTPGALRQVRGQEPKREGTLLNGRRLLGEVIFVTEERRRERPAAEHAGLLEGKPMHVLDIPDEYRFMDPELVDKLQRSVGAILGLDEASSEGPR